MNLNKRKLPPTHPTNLIGGVFSIFLGIFLWILTRQPPARPNPGEEVFGNILGWIALIVLLPFGLNLIYQWFKGKNINK